MIESYNHYQTFIAPGDEDEELPIKHSPWVIDRIVSIPMRYWNVLLEYAEATNKKKGEKLDNACWSRIDEDYNIYLSDDEIDELILFMEELCHKLKSEPKDPIDGPEGLYNEEYINIFKVVILIFKESKSRKQPFQGWR